MHPCMEAYFKMANGKTLHMTIFRSGERGLLTYDGETKLMNFYKWDSVKSINWAPVADVQ
jgi:hypothetical protein